MARHGVCISGLGHIDGVGLVLSGHMGYGIWEHGEQAGVLCFLQYVGMGKAEAGLGYGKNYMPRGESTSALLLHGRRVLVSVVLMH